MVRRLVIVLAALAGCGQTKTETYFRCTVCLADDATRCATHVQACGDLPSHDDAVLSGSYALCDSLTPAELARRPTPPDFTPSTFYKNACYRWPDDAFKATCTTFPLTCGNVPIH